MKHGVTDLFGVESADIVTPVVLVGGIDSLEGLELWVIGGLFPCGGGEDQAVNILHFPVIAEEAECEVIEKFRVRWGASEGTEVAGIGSESAAEAGLPDAIDDDSAGKRIIRTCEPPGQRRSTSG